MSDSWSSLATNPFGSDAFDQAFFPYDEHREVLEAPFNMPAFSSAAMPAFSSADMPAYSSADMQAFLSTAIQDFPPAYGAAFPSANVQAFHYAQTPASPPASSFSQAPAVTYPPSPPTSIEPSSIPKSSWPISYLEALHRGNVLLCLPHNIRTHLYTTILALSPELRTIEVPESGVDVSKAFPPFCHTLDMIYFPTCLLLIENATFTLSSDGAIFNLMVFLNEFVDQRGAKTGYEAVRSLEFAGRAANPVVGLQEGSALELFEHGVFTSNATKLLRKCPNVQHVSLALDLNNLPWTFEQGGRQIDIAALTEQYDLAAILDPHQIETVTLSLKPFMALEKTVRAMEEESKIHQLRGWLGAGLDGFWGLKDWFEGKGLEKMRLVDVRCPTLEQLV